MSKILSIFNSINSSVKNTLIIIAVVALLVGLVVAVIKSKHARFFTFVTLSIVLIISGIYSILQLNFYYKSKGGIVGEITGIFKPNEVTVVDDLVFDFNHIELKLLHDDTYRASITTNEIVELPVGDTYAVLVNNMPCANLSDSSNYVLSEYSYVFFDENKDEILTDTLTIRVAIYELCTNIQVETSGGSQAVELWNEFFNKNGFKITLTVDKYIPYEDNDSNSSDISNYSIVRYYYNDELYLTQIYKTGEKINLPKIDDYRFQYWMLDNAKIDSNFYVTESIDLTAYVLDEFVITVVIEDESFENPYLTKSILANETLELDEPVDPIPNDLSHWVFDGYSLDGINKIELEDITITEDSTIYVLFHYEYDVTVFFDSVGAVQLVKHGDKVVSPTVPEYFVLNGYSVNDEEIDIDSYVITEPTNIHAIGYYEYPVNYIVNDTVYYTTQTKRLEAPAVPENPTISGQIFLGWSKDGHTLIEDMSSEEITSSTTYYAVFSAEQFVLTILNNNETDTVTMNGTVGSTVSLTPPTYEGHSFVEWRIQSGEGTINGNEFTFASSDCVVYAVYDFATCNISSKLSFDLTYDGNTQTVNVSGMGSFASASKTIETNNSDSVTIKSNAVSSTLPTVTTDGEYTVTGSHDTGYTITWTNCSYIKIEMFATNAGSV